MAARVGHFELIVRVDFLARLHVEDHRTAVAQPDAAAVGVERDLGIDELRGVRPAATECLAALSLRLRSAAR